MNDHTKSGAGTFGKGKGFGNPGYGGARDRDILMYWALAYKQSFETRARASSTLSPTAL